jgi:hypothetical protein
MSRGWQIWRCGYCRGEGVPPDDVSDVYAWFVASHGPGKCVPHPGFVDGAGI